MERTRAVDALYGHILPSDPASCAHLARRQWRKLRPEGDAQALEIRAMEVTGNHTGDAAMLAERLSQIAAVAALATVTTDGAYDSYLCHAAIVSRGVAAIIPPRRNGQFCKGNALGKQARNESLRSAKCLGANALKKLDWLPSAQPG